MVEFCPHCGEIGGLVQKDDTLFCSRCGKQAGVIAPVPRSITDQADTPIRQGSAAQCPVCQQLVELRGKTLAPHYGSGTPRKVCPGSAKQPATAAPAALERPPVGGKDFTAHMTREVVRLVSYARGAAPRIEELTLDYLDKRDRVRIQIEALREILGPDFRMRDYPPALGRPELVVWASAAMCVVGKRQVSGGYQPMSDAEVALVVADLPQHAQLFFA